MADPLAVIIRFRGDPDGLLRGFEDARVWESAVGHRAFGEQLHGLIDAAGLPHPEQIERMKVDSLGWD